jgi:poly(A) polymerase
MKAKVDKSNHSFLDTTALQKVFEALGKTNVRCVGGCVRNAILNIPVSDVDLATTHHPDIVIALLQKRKILCVPTGIEHGTVTAVIDGIGYQITSLRQDVETDGRRAVIRYTDDWVEDAKRRDFTINALYLDFRGQIYDPLGTGLRDLERRKISFIGKPEDRIREDYLRILRFFRFHAHYGVGPLDGAGLKASTDLASGLKKISRERVTEEFLKIVIAPRADYVLNAMVQSGIMTTLFSKNFSAVTLKTINRLENLCDKNGILAKLFLTISSTIYQQEKANLSLILTKKMKRDLQVLHSLVRTTKRFDRHMLQKLLYQYPHTIVENFIFIWSSLQNKPMVECRRLFKLYQSTEKPLFPITGKDLKSLGFTESPDLGATLKKLETAWIKSGFEISRADLLKKLS